LIAESNGAPIWKKAASGLRLFFAMIFLFPVSWQGRLVIAESRRYFAHIYVISWDSSIFVA